MPFLLQMQGKMLLLLLILSGYEEQLGFKDLECPLKKKFKKKFICKQCNNGLDRNQTNLQCMFIFPSATTCATAKRSEKYQNVHLVFAPCS